MNKNRKVDCQFKEESNQSHVDETMGLHNLPSNHRCRRQYGRQENLSKKRSLSQNRDNITMSFL